MIKQRMKNPLFIFYTFLKFGRNVHNFLLEWKENRIKKEAAMRKYAMYIPLGLMLLIPLGVLFGELSDYEWAWEGPWIFSMIFTLLFCASVFAVPKHTMPAPLAGLCLLLSVVNEIMMIFISLKPDDVLAYEIFLVCIAAAVILLIRAKPHKGWKIVSSVAALLLSAFFLPAMSFALLIGYTEVVDTVYSPDGRYRAELLDVNEGALGGDTVVLVYDERGSLDLGFCTLQKEPKIAYMGPWGEFKDMDLAWESDTVLLIDGRAYDIEEETP